MSDKKPNITNLQSVFSNNCIVVEHNCNTRQSLYGNTQLQFNNFGSYTHNGKKYYFAEGNYSFTANRRSSYREDHQIFFKNIYGADIKIEISRIQEK